MSGNNIENDLRTYLQGFCSLQKGGKLSIT